MTPDQEPHLPTWLERAISRQHRALMGLIDVVMTDPHFVELIDEDRKASGAAPDLWGAEQILEDVEDRLERLVNTPELEADDVDGLVGSLWKLSYRLRVVATTLDAHALAGESSEGAVYLARGIADALNHLGTLADLRPGPE